MPDSFVQLPADGAGKQLKTFTDGTTHIQYVNLMDKLSYSLESGFIAAGAAGAVVRPLTLLLPAGSTKIVKIREIWTVCGNATPVAAAGIFEVQAFRITAFTGGTVLTPSSLDTADPASTFSGVTQVAQGATAATAATGANAWSSRWAMSWGTAVQNGILPGQVVQLGETGSLKPLVLRAGQGITIAVLTRVAGGQVAAGLEWTEE